MPDHTPFHEGEREVQNLAGERSIADRNGVVIGPRVPNGAIQFLAQQRMLVIGTVDQNGTPWASMIVGHAGFAQCDPGGTEIEVDLSLCHISSADILWNNLAVDPRLGMLAIELASRRRLRVNGRVLESNDLQMRIAVEEAYPNCPKYIQRRHMADFDLGGADNTAAAVTEALSEAQAETIHRADTLFIASVNGAGSVDASHRGGPPGFAEILDDRTLRIPDYAGNSMFNTLGNIHAYPRAGLVFMDFETSRVLQVAGEASVHFGEPDPQELTGGTKRFWELHVESVREWDLGITVDWEFLDASPFNPVPTEAPGSGGAS